MCVEFCCLSSGDEKYEEGWVLVLKGELTPKYKTYSGWQRPPRFFDTKAEAIAVAEGIKEGCATCFFRPYDEAQKVQELREFYEKLDGR